MEQLIDIREDRSERVRYDAADFPVYISRSDLCVFPDYSAASHWHDDVELILVLSGRMDYNVNGEIIRLTEGNGIFVNARQLHYGFSAEHHQCEFICVLFHPLRLCSSLRLEQQYLSPLLSDESIPCCHLHRDIPWQKQILEDVEAMYAVRDLEAAELQVQSLFYRMWWNLYTNLHSGQKQKKPDNHRLSALKAMLSYIETNYQNPITLDDISAAGNVGKTSCYNLFQKYVNQAPNLYLINFRLGKGAELLVSSELSIAEICYEVGFGGASYFAEMFRKRYNCSPSAYRRERGRKL